MHKRHCRFRRSFLVYAVVVVVCVVLKLVYVSYISFVSLEFSPIRFVPVVRSPVFYFVPLLSILLLFSLDFFARTVTL